MGIGLFLCPAGSVILVLSFWKNLAYEGQDGEKKHRPLLKLETADGVTSKPRTIPKEPTAPPASQILQDDKR
jgi:hypothetical protein